MAEFDEAFDAEAAIVDCIVDQLHALRRRKPNPYNFPGDVQAAFVLRDMVVPVPSAIVWSDDRLYALALDLADSIKERRWGNQWQGKGVDDEWDEIADELREWAEWVEQQQNDPKNNPIEPSIRDTVLSAALVAWEDASEAVRQSAKTATATPFSLAQPDADERMRLGFAALHVFAGLSDDAKAGYLERVTHPRDVPRIMEAMKRHDWPRPVTGEPE